MIARILAVLGSPETDFTDNAASCAMIVAAVLLLVAL